MQVSMKNKFSHDRLESLDWLRGLLAMSIMLYHLYSWNISNLPSETLLGRLGIYGVSMFFVLSGLSMAVVYSNKLNHANKWVSFFIRRAFRILPLLCIAVLSTYIISMIANKDTISPYILIINLTGTFGFIDPGAYINTGAWSIGNELVYYSLTPAILMIYDKSIKAGNALFCASIAIGLIFSFSLISDKVSIASQWSIYINPFNNIFLYISGIAIYYNSKNKTHSPTTSILSTVAGLFILILYPSGGGQESIVTGTARLAFSLASILIVYGFYRYRNDISRSISYPLEIFGSATYGIYLLHPIFHTVFLFFTNKTGINLPPYASIALTSALSIASAVFIYKYIEIPMIKTGRIISEKTSYLMVRAKL